MKNYFQIRLLWGLAIFTSGYVVTAFGQTNQVLAPINRPFEAIVSILSTKPLEAQYIYILRLSKGLTPDPHLGGSHSDLPLFDDLVRELIAQKQYELMYALLKKREISPENYLSIASVLAEKLDPATFTILLTNSEPGTVDAPIDRGYKEGTNIIASEGFPEFSCALLGLYYLKSDLFHDKTQAHLIKVLKYHHRSGARAEAAHRLGYSNDPEVVKALEDATHDMASFPNSNGPYDYVYQYAEDSLKKIQSRGK